GLRSELDADPARHGLPPGPRRWVLGMLASKEGPQILEALLAPGDRAWIVPVAGHASWTLPQLEAVLAAGAHPRLVEQLRPAPDPGTAIRQAAEQTSDESGTAGTVLVAGSLYLIGQLLAREA
ncbi:MAG: hypothetical protein WBN89_13155, partial [Prochlorococcaceae cyanobacterium]